MRLNTAASAIAISTALLAHTAAAQAEQMRFEIAAKPVSEALQDFAEQSGFQMAFLADAAAGVPARPVSGALEPEAALRRLLEGTGLEFRFIDERTIAILQKTTNADNESRAEQPASQYASAADQSRSSAPIQQIAQAQTQTQTAQAQTQAAVGDSAELEEIVVTGSRISRPGFQSASPIMVVNAEQISFSGEQTVEEVLNEIPQLSPAETSTTNNGGSGLATLNLRDLGAQRTLVMVNGRRMVATDARGRVDVNNIPLALIDRVDVVTGGQSAVYGSDAVAGVVNFIMKDDFEGLDITGQYKISERGDGDTRTANITMGSNFADGRGNIVAHVNFTNRLNFLQGDRSFSREVLQDVGGEFVPAGSSRIPGGRTVQPVDEDGNVLPVILSSGELFDGEIKFNEAGEAIPRAGETFNFAPFSNLQSPFERFLIYTQGHYDFSDRHSFYFEANFSNVQQSQNTPFDSATIEVDDMLKVALDNPALLQPTVDFLRQNFDTGIGLDESEEDGIATLSFLSRRAVELGLRTIDRDFTMFRGVSGFKGTLFDDWEYDASFSFARVTRSLDRFNFLSDDRAQAGLLGCPPGSDAQCVPVNVFGAGNISEEAADFLNPLGITSAETEQMIFQGSVNGPIERVDFGAGPALIAAGIEFRDEEADFRPSEQVQRDSETQPTQGGFDVLEFFGEARIPVLEDLPLAKSFVVQLAARASDYDQDNVGGVFTWNALGQWEPISGIRLRGGFQRAIRAPNINELFQGEREGARNTSDPCGFQNIENLPTAATVQQRVSFCQDLGVPDPLNLFSDRQSTVLIGGNPDLEEETADTWTVGAIFQPEGIPGLSATVDYFRIELEDAVRDLSPDTILGLCIDSMNVENKFCQRVQRRPIGEIALVDSVIENIASELREGIDWDIDYEITLPWGASLRLKNNGNFMFRNRFTPAPGQARIDCNGVFGGACNDEGDPISPEWRVNQFVTYSEGAWDVQVQNRIIGGFDNFEPVGAANPSTDPNLYVDLVFNNQVTDYLKVTFGVDNLTDNKPPILGDANGTDANTDPQVFDVLLRAYFASVSVSF